MTTVAALPSHAATPAPPVDAVPAVPPVLRHVAAGLAGLLAAAYAAAAIWFVGAVAYPVAGPLLPWAEIARSAGASAWLAALCWAYVSLLLWFRRMRGVLLSLVCTPMMAAVAAVFGADRVPSGWPLAAFSPLQLAAQLRSDQGTGVALPLAPWQWGAFAAHVLLVMPVVVAWRRERAHGRWLARVAQAEALERQREQERLEAERRLRESTLTLPPEITAPLLGQPFRILGLRPADARARTIMRRRDDMLGLLAAGLSVETDLPGYLAVALPAAPAIDEVAVRNAVARIQQDLQRCDEALLWFHVEPEDTVVVEALARGDLASADAAWLASAAPTALYNRAVLAWARALDEEQANAPPQSTPDASRWKDCHALWVRVLAESGCWSGLERLVANCSDPRIGAGHLETLKSRLPMHVLGAHRDLVRLAVDRKFVTYARWHLDLVMASGLPASACSSVREECLAPRVDAARRALAPFLDERAALTAVHDYEVIAKAYDAESRLLEGLGARDRLEGLAVRVIAEACERLPRETFGPWRSFHDEDQACFAGTARVIEIWNVLASGQPHADMGALRQTIGLMRERGAAVKHLQATLRAYELVAGQALRAIEVLKVVVRDAGPEQLRAVEKLAVDEARALEKAVAEMHKTQEHFERNLGGMVSALGG